MKETDIKQEIYKFYNLNKRTKLYFTRKDHFEIKLGDCLIELPYPPIVMRELKLNEILNES